MRYRFEDLTIDLTAESVFRHETKLDISGLNFKLLAFMVRQGVNVMSFDQIIEGVWSPARVSNETITQRVRLLRVALDCDNAPSQYIRSVRGRGYQLCGEPELLPELANAPDSLKKKNQKWIVVGTVLLAILIFIVGIYFSQNEPVTPDISSYQKRLERAQFYLNQGEKADIERALNILALIEVEGHTDTQWLIAKSFALSAKVCRFGADVALAEEAEHLSKQALNMENPASYAYFTLGFSHDCRGHTNEAMTYYRQAIDNAVDPRQVNSSALAYLLGETGALAESLALHKSLEVNKVKEDFLYLQLGRNYELLQYPRLANEYYQLSFELYPDNLFSNVALPYYLFKQGFVTQSQKLIEVTETRPHHADLYLLKAEHYFLQNDKTSAMASIEKAIALEPNNLFYQTVFNLHQVVQDTRYFETRLTDIESYSRLNDNATAALELALVYSALNMEAQANAMLVHAITVGYLDAQLLQRSYLYSPLRTLSGFDDAIEAIEQRVAIERAKVPREHLSIAIIER